ncbi:hypothetical protein A2U01_0066948 [Trifolium medium]|uniref:Uncharacterized protein n=1 Tax=Trifolium medium TaxID=97028 RepID=A0A392SAL0_9FABA|nr:hypothetical protein [Trifolium medium]
MLVKNPNFCLPFSLYHLKSAAATNLYQQVAPRAGFRCNNTNTHELCAPHNAKLLLAPWAVPNLFSCSITRQIPTIFTLPFN